MKKIFLFLLLATSSVVSFAQIFQVEAITEKGFFGREYYIYLSNGDQLDIDGKDNVYCSSANGKIVKVIANITPSQVRKGTLIEKRGRVYNAVSAKKISTKKIKYAKIRQVSAEFNASLYGSFSYRTFLSIGRGRGKINGEASGGQRTIVNIVFEDNTSASIEASDDPIWLEAKTGMQVEYYKCGTYNIYKLIFQ